MSALEPGPLNLKLRALTIGPLHLKTGHLDSTFPCSINEQIKKQLVGLPMHYMLSIENNKIVPSAPMHS